MNNLVFIGTPAISVPTLDKMINDGFKPSLVITQPDRAKGRNRRLLPPEVKIKAMEHQIPVIQPEDINQADTIRILGDLNPDMIITFSYGGMIGKEIRDIPKYGAINIHPSLLPYYRGATPIRSVLANGDKETGITIFQITRKMDAGPILYQKKYPVFEEDNNTSLEQRLSMHCADDLIDFLHLCSHLCSFDDYLQLKIPQNHDIATYTQKVSRETNQLDWAENAQLIHHKIRSLAEEPGAFSYFRDTEIKIIKSCITDHKSLHDPGYISSVIKNEGFTVSTGDFDLMIKSVQPQGKRIMSAHEYQLGARLQIGDCFRYGI